MYWRHFNLTAEPFSLTPDPSFLYLSPVHAEAFAAMTMGLRERRGLITMIGEVGTGKTTLVYSLLSGLGPEIHTAYISNARLSFDGILRLALRDFGVPCASANNADLLDAFNKFLLDCATQGTTAALVIDEAQNLSQETFEDLRLLSNFETYTHKLLQIVLVGQPELDAKLREPSLRQVAERVAVRCVVNPLTRGQSRQYLEHRLAAVNGSLSLFTGPALRLLIGRSRGIPRSLNILAHNAMLFAYGEESSRVVRRFVAAAVSEKEGNTIVRLWRRPKRTQNVGPASPTTRRRNMSSLWALTGAAIAGLAVGFVLAGTDWASKRGGAEQRPWTAEPASPAPIEKTAAVVAPSAEQPVAQAAPEPSVVAADEDVAMIPGVDAPLPPSALPEEHAPVAPAEPVVEVPVVEPQGANAIVPVVAEVVAAPAPVPVVQPIAAAAAPVVVAATEPSAPVPVEAPALSPPVVAAATAPALAAPAAPVAPAIVEPVVAAVAAPALPSVPADRHRSAGCDTASVVANTIAPRRCARAHGGQGRATTSRKSGRGDDAVYESSTAADDARGRAGRSACTGAGQASRQSGGANSGRRTAGRRFTGAAAHRRRRASGSRDRRHRTRRELALGPDVVCVRPVQLADDGACPSCEPASDGP